MITLKTLWNAQDEMDTTARVDREECCDRVRGRMDDEVDVYHTRYISRSCAGKEAHLWRLSEMTGYWFPQDTGVEARTVLG